MGYNNHKGTVGHAVGASIIGKDTGMPKEPDDSGKSAGFEDMRIKPSNNGGFVVHHTPLSKGGKSPATPSPVAEQTNVFKTGQEAHHHIGQLLGVRLGSGQVKVG